MGPFTTHLSVRPAKAAALALAALLALAPVVALADEDPVDGAPAEAVEVAPASEPSDGAAEPTATGEAAVGTRAVGNGVGVLRLAQGVKDHGRAQGVVDAVNAYLGGAPLAVDGRLQETAVQRAAETSLWLSQRRPNGEPLPVAAAELRCNGKGVEPATVASQVLASGAGLAGGTYRSIGVGCWEQGGERFYVVLLGTEPATTPATGGTGAEPWSPEVEVDFSGRTSTLLPGRLQASGYRTNLSMVPDSTRAVRFSWVTAPEEGALSSASDLPTISIDPSSFDWTSSNGAVASVSPAGVVTMRGTSVLTPSVSREAGSDITASLGGTDRSLTFHVSAAVPVYRLYNPGDGSHLYTTDANEYATLPQVGWTPEQVVWQSVWSPDASGQFTGTPIYRLYNPFNGDHHYTADSNEYASLPGSGWRQEGVAYFSADGTWDGELGGRPVYRLYNGFQTANGGLGSHLWTTDANEYATLGGQGWTQEGTGLYGVR